LIKRIWNFHKLRCKGYSAAKELGDKIFLLRSSIVSRIKRENRQPAPATAIPVIHYDFIPDSDVLDFLFMTKGSGSENMSFMTMLVPADGVNGIKRFVLEHVVGAAQALPAKIVGVGIGVIDLCMTWQKSNDASARFKESESNYGGTRGRVVRRD